MVRQWPTSILILAILHLVAGGFGIFGSCYSVVIMATACSASSPATVVTPAPTNQPGRPSTSAPPSASQIMKYYEEHIPGYKAFTFTALAVDLVLDLMLLASGIGLLLMHPWARVLSLIYAPLSILFHVISFAYQLIFVMPATHDIFAQMSSVGPMGSLLAAITDISLIVSSLVIIYPIVVLILLLRPSTVSAFRGEAPSKTDEGIPDDSYPPDSRGDDYTN
jgi:hypothetical protein